MTDVELAWAAGFIDGEGCITTRVRRKKRTTRSYDLLLTVGQVNPEPLRRLEAMFGGSTTIRPTQRRPLHVWRVANNRAAEALRAMRPFLVGKAIQADLALAIRDDVNAAHREPSRGRAGLPEARHAYRLSLITALVADKHRSYPERG